MEIVIENPSDVNAAQAGLPFQPHQSQRSIYGPDGAAKLADGNFYATLPARLRERHLLVPGNDLTGASITATSSRRVDRSGLLEIPEPEPPRCRSRFSAERSAVLEVVPEVPDQFQANNPPTVVERHLTGAEDGPPASANPSPRPCRSPSTEAAFKQQSLSRRVSFDDDKPRDPRTVLGASAQYARLRDNPTATLSPVLADHQRNQSGFVVQLDDPQCHLVEMTSSKEEKLADFSGDKKPDCLERLSPRAHSERRPSTTLSSIPDVIETHSSSSMMSAVSSQEPQGERAEAEGCEHTVVESLEEARVSYKTPNKILHKDNIQAVHVIILSEQL